MKRPGTIERTLERIHKWRDICPEITLRSTFIVGYPGETEQDFELLLDFLSQAQLDRVGCFPYSPVEGAAANQLANQIPEHIKQERFHRFMQLQQTISTRKLQNKIGKTLSVLIDEVDDEGAIGRSMADAPEIDGVVYLNEEKTVKVGDIVKVNIEHSDEYDLWGTVQQ